MKYLAKIIIFTIQDLSVWLIAWWTYVAFYLSQIGYISLTLEEPFRSLILQIYLTDFYFEFFKIPLIFILYNLINDSIWQKFKKALS